MLLFPWEQIIQLFQTLDLVQTLPFFLNSRQNIFEALQNMNVVLVPLLCVCGCVSVCVCVVCVCLCVVY